MKIQCLHNSAKALPKNLIGKNCFIKDPNTNFLVKINEVYNVYAMQIYDGYVWYAICSDFNSTPMWYASPLFRIVDKRISRYWIYNYCFEGEDSYIRPKWTFPDWANTSYFYDEVIDHPIGAESKIFNSYKQKMDLEFPRPDITIKAEIGDNKWLVCPKCIDAWQWPSNRDALVKCPVCETVYNNPRYDLKDINE